MTKVDIYWSWDSLIKFHKLCSTESLDFTTWNYKGKSLQALLERKWSAFPVVRYEGNLDKYEGDSPTQHIGRWAPAFQAPFKTSSLVTHTALGFHGHWFFFFFFFSWLFIVGFIFCFRNDIWKMVCFMEIMSYRKMFYYLLVASASLLGSALQ